MSQKSNDLLGDDRGARSCAMRLLSLEAYRQMLARRKSPEWAVDLLFANIGDVYPKEKCAKAIQNSLNPKPLGKKG